ncbi:hypothetical protein GPJ56_008072 [Histomonas meleagridis]|uniref:uncharacterized protein n=1 Tax=Histomonas meleagridis TaxID=135588 RepID=UPI00355AB699|nr:hypothetical protein GPJ56_008072 [Histomonas meleagridis]KAH0798976.1 hypothetical protein GO595_008266 [Histomonas meleagridis]
MEALHQLCNKLSELFQHIIENKDNPNTQVLEELVKTSQVFATILRKKPELSEDEYVVEILEIYSGVYENDCPNIYKACSDVVKSCLNSLSGDKLNKMWNTSNETSLCYYISVVTAIENVPFCQKFLFWIENPQIDILWFKRFVGILKKQSVDIFETKLINEFPKYLVDRNPLKSTLCYLFLNSFSKINSSIALSITSAWLSVEQKTQHAANHCRLILKNAPKSVINLISTLTFDFPIILPIIPPTADGFQMLSNTTVHRIKTFDAQNLPQFLELCDTKVREIVKKDHIDIPPELRIYDAAFSNDLKTKEIESLFNSIDSTDFYTSALLFARYTPISNAAKHMNHEVVQSIRKMIETPPSLTAAYVPSSEIDQSLIDSIHEMIEHNQINDLLKVIPNRII